MSNVSDVTCSSIFYPCYIACVYIQKCVFFVMGYKNTPIDLDVSTTRSETWEDVIHQFDELEKGKCIKTNDSVININTATPYNWTR